MVVIVTLFLREPAADVRFTDLLTTGRHGLIQKYPPKPIFSGSFTFLGVLAETRTRNHPSEHGSDVLFHDMEQRGDSASNIAWVSFCHLRTSNMG
jgi:hypothetical protein